jgi:hypothetical protein
VVNFWFITVIMLLIALLVVITTIRFIRRWYKGDLPKNDSQAKQLDVIIR